MREELIFKIEYLGKDTWGFKLSSSYVEKLPKLEEIKVLVEEKELEKAEEEIRNILNETPLHFDALTIASVIMDQKDRTEEALLFLNHHILVILLYFPIEFHAKKSMLPWSYLENRPFLNLYHMYGILFNELGLLSEARYVYEKLIEWNPHDEQEIREELCYLYFDMGKPEDVLSLCAKYKNDKLPWNTYGKGLALYQLGKIEKAKKALEQAVMTSPLVALELMKTRHKKPKRDIPLEYIPTGSPDEAYYYWKIFGEHWENTGGALSFLKEVYNRKKP